MRIHPHAMMMNLKKNDASVRELDTVHWLHGRALCPCSWQVAVQDLEMCMEAVWKSHGLALNFWPCGRFYLEHIHGGRFAIRTSSSFAHKPPDRAEYAMQPATGPTWLQRISPWNPWSRGTFREFWVRRLRRAHEERSCGKIMRYTVIHSRSKMASESLMPSTWCRSSKKASNAGITNRREWDVGKWPVSHIQPVHDARSHLGRSHVEAYGHYIKLLYLQGIETNGLMQCFSEAFSMPEPRQDDGDSDESIPEETHPNRWTERVLATWERQAAHKTIGAAGMRFCSMAFIANFHTVPQKLRHQWIYNNPDEHSDIAPKVHIEAGCKIFTVRHQCLHAYMSVMHSSC